MEKWEIEQEPVVELKRNTIRFPQIRKEKYVGREEERTQNGVGRVILVI